MTKILVIGSGFLGKHVITEFKNIEIESYGTSFSKDNKLKLDITNINSIKKNIEKIKPNIIINCAANTNLDFLETHQDIAFDINANGVQNLIEVVRQNNIRLVHISTDSIFDGSSGSYSENDIPNPINVYSKSKLLGEKYILNNLKNEVIIRTNFYGHDNDNKFLFNQILNSLKNKKTFTAFDDIIFNPLEISNLSKMIVEISLKNYTGIINMASDDILSKYEFAIEISKNLDYDQNLIKKGNSNEMNFTANRPKNTSLTNYRMKNEIKTKITTLSNWLKMVKNDYNP